MGRGGTRPYQFGKDVSVVSRYFLILPWCGTRGAVFSRS